jgi:Dockerin type I domain/Matrixin
MIQRTKQRKRSLRLEHLEKRDLFARDSIAFSGYGSLTFSIAPDGTHVGNEVSTLQSHFNQVAPATQWQQAIARAFQKWSVNANINIGNVADNGAASGVYGPTRGDERFGDIRVTGFDYATDSFAEAVSENSRSVGTWAGDVFFNTAVDWKDLNSIEAAALHEVGHILGLGHSDDPASPMHVHGPSGALELTTQDILNLQAIHGTRHLDPNEGGNGNDSIDRASRIKGGEDDSSVLDGFSGNQVWIQFGDLHNANDRDVYEIRTSLNYSGPLSVELRTSGLSLAKLGAEITDRNGNILSQSQMSGDFGGVSVLTLNQTTPDGKYYLQVHAGSDRLWATGDYSITVANPTRLEADADTIAEWTRNAHRWYYDSDRTRDGFSYQLVPSSSNGPTTDDKHTDDTIGKSVDIPLALTTDTRIVYQAVGTISDLVDIDHYRVFAPKVLNGKNELVIDLESLKVGGLVPQVQLFDNRGVAIQAELRVQGYGQTQLVLGNVQPEQAIIIELKANSVANEFKTGSFSLNATFSSPSQKPELLVSGVVSAGTGTIEREWYVARPQLFGLSLEGLTASQAGEGNVWVSVFDDQRHLVAGLVAPLNSLRSAPGLFLNPGKYYFQIAAESSSPTPNDVAIRFLVERPSNPIGPVLGGTGVQPMYLCPGSTTQYCYPDSPTPIATTQKVGIQPTVPLPTPSRAQVQPSPSSWYWSNDFLPTNPTNALDVTGNGSVDPLDVLVIVNAINSIGFGPVPTPPQFLGYLDVNANGLIDPLDALVVINYLNAK